MDFQLFFVDSRLGLFYILGWRNTEDLIKLYTSFKEKNFFLLIVVLYCYIAKKAQETHNTRKSCRYVVLNCNKFVLLLILFFTGNKSKLGGKSWPGKGIFFGGGRAGKWNGPAVDRIRL